MAQKKMFVMQGGFPPKRKGLVGGLTLPEKGKKNHFWEPAGVPKIRKKTKKRTPWWKKKKSKEFSGIVGEKLEWGGLTRWRGGEARGT